MSVYQQYDVIIIGMGPGGGTLAYKLAPLGKKSSCWSAVAICRGRRTTGVPRRFIDNKYEVKGGRSLCREG